MSDLPDMHAKSLRADSLRAYVSGSVVLVKVLIYF